MITVGSLFAGIGGLELGLEMTGGFKTVWQVENDKYATRVLEKHWPDVRRWGDVATFPPDDGHDYRCDLICGGFPCQDISYAGKGEGLGGERSGLFYEAARVIRILEPRYVLLENVSALLTRGLDAVLGTLASLGYDAEWHCIPAAAVGAPHIRDRVFIIGYANASAEHRAHNDTTAHERGWVGTPLSDAASGRTRRGKQQPESGEETGDVADAEQHGRQQVPQVFCRRKPILAMQSGDNRGGARLDGNQDGQWSTLAGFYRMAHGVSSVFHGDMSHDATRSQKTGTTSIPESEALPTMRSDESKTIRETSPELCETVGGGDSLSGLPREGRPRGGAAAEQGKTPMRGLREDVYVHSQQQQDLLTEVLANVGHPERQQAMEGAFSVEELCFLRDCIHAAKGKGDDVLGVLWQQTRMEETQSDPWVNGEWPDQPRVETGVANRVDRLRCLGNAVVPQVAQYIGERILEHERKLKADN